MPRFIIFLIGVLAYTPVNYTSPLFPHSFSYTRFSGPVSGPEKEIEVYNPKGLGYSHVDYVAKPDYQFSYGIDDPLSNVLQNRKERRFGDKVQGEYSFIEPNGSLRIVKYVADDARGFQAEVITEKLPVVGAIHPPIADATPVHEKPEMYADCKPVVTSASHSTNKEGSFNRTALSKNDGETDESSYSEEHSSENISTSNNANQKSKNNDDFTNEEYEDGSY